MTAKIAVNGVTRIFGRHPRQALDLLKAGLSKEEIFKRTGQTVGVLDASFEVEAGEIFVIMGLSGSGKSTLVRMLNRLIDPTAGEIRIDGRDITKLSRAELTELRRRDLGMVFQSFALLPHLRVWENAAFGLEIAGESLKARRDKAQQALDAVGLGAYAESFPRELSGGMQQRVGLARAFATGAPILLMDEPFSALDPLIRTRLQDELLEFQRRLKKTILFVSHDLDEAFRIGNRIAIMEGGRIIQCGTPQEIVKNPANQYVADFVQNMNPINMLTAGDVMQHGASSNGGVTATAAPQTPLVDILDAMARTPGNVGVVDNGTVVGTINAQDIVNGLTRHRRRG